MKRDAYLGHDAAPLFEFLEPIRVVLRHQQNATVLLDEVIGIAARQVKTRFGAAQSYDYLVLATGSQRPGSAAQMTAPALGRGTASSNR